MFMTIKRIWKLSIYSLSRKELDAAVPNAERRAESYMPHMSAYYRIPLYAASRHSFTRMFIMPSLRRSKATYKESQSLKGLAKMKYDKEHKDSLSKYPEFIEAKAKVIYESDTDDIINQYIIFCKVFNEQTKKHGMTQKAVTETIRICKDRNVLKEYLLEREKEVVTIMMSLFDDEQIMKSFIRSERHEAAQESARETAKKLIKKGKMTLDEIADCVPLLSLDELKEIENEIMQLA